MEVVQRPHHQRYLDELSSADAIIDAEIAQNPELKYTREERFQLKLALLALLVRSNQHFGNTKLIVECLEKNLKG